MRVGFLTSDLHHRHGWGHYSLSLIEALRRQGLEVTVLAARNSPTDFDFPIVPLLPKLARAEPNQLLKMAALVPEVRRLLHGCDIVHATAEPYAPLALAAAAGRPYLITGHGSYAQAGVNRSPLVRPLHRLSFRHAHTLVCVSHYTAKVAEAYTPGVHTAVVNNGVDVERFADLPPLVPPVTRPVVLTAGGIKPRKGTLQLVRAVDAVRRIVPDVLCVIVGNLYEGTDYSAAVQAEIKALALMEHVRLLGFVPEETLLAWYSAATVFAMPSINDGWNFEGYGLVHLEASAAGLPVIGTRDCGAEDAIRDGETGFLIPQEGVEQGLATALLRLLHDPALAARMGAAGRAFARQHTWDAAAAQTLSLYEQALAR